MISGAGLCWQHVGGVGSTTTTLERELHDGGGGSAVNYLTSSTIIKQMKIRERAT